MFDDEKDLYQQLNLARQKGLVASVLHIDNLIRIRFNRSEDYQTKQDRIREYIIKKYKHIDRITICGRMMYVYTRT